MDVVRPLDLTLVFAHRLTSIVLIADVSIELILSGETRTHARTRVPQEETCRAWTIGSSSIAGGKNISNLISNDDDDDEIHVVLR